MAVFKEPDHRPLHPTHDNSTQSNYHDLVTTHLDLKWTVDWSLQLIHGSVTLSFKAVKDKVSHIILDTRYLQIASVKIAKGKYLKWTLEKRHKVMGSALTIELDKALTKEEEVKVTIDYQTTSDCTALGWLKPEQTHSKKYGFLYSQCQAIHARSLLPCQDTPAIKNTYTASVKSPLPILMSALRISPPSSEIIEIDSGKIREYVFDQPIKIPSYLIAVAGGELEFASLGERTGVWAQPGVIRDAEWEFKEDSEKFVQIAEQVTTPYKWGRFDMLILPNSFAYGGMENPNMTFLTPALIVGDRSQVDVVGHELSHSWFGNGITCNSWDSFWLNEGWTTHCERIITGEMNGPAARDFEFIVGRQGLDAALKQQEKEPRFQRLQIPYLEGEDPDDAFSSVPYDKGANFLLYIERTVGGLEVFKPYMISYVKRFDGLSISTADWLDHFWDYWNQFPSLAAKLKREIDFDAWLNGEGLDLPVEIKYDTSIADQAYLLAKKWNASRDDPKAASKFSKKDLENWSSPTVGMFLDTLTGYPAFEDAKIVELVDKAYGFNTSANPETRSRWYQFALKSRCFKEDAAVWVRDQGRMKYVRSHYRALAKVDEKLAKDTFLEYGVHFLHPIARALVAKDLGLEDSGDDVAA